MVFLVGQRLSAGQAAVIAPARVQVSPAGPRLRWERLLVVRGPYHR